MTDTAGRTPHRGRRLYRIARGALALGMLLQIVLVCTPLTERLLRGLTVSGPARHADVIVCLGGGVERVAYAADLFHGKFAPIVVVTDPPGGAEEMRDMLVRSGVPAKKVLVDATSYRTADHPRGVARLPGISPGTQRFVLVTDEAHSRRAAACFRRAGYRDVSVYSGPPLPPGRAPASNMYRWRLYHLPHIACEYAALVEYRLAGWI